MYYNGINNKMDYADYKYKTFKSSTNYNTTDNDELRIIVGGGVGSDQYA